MHPSINDRDNNLISYVALQVFDKAYYEALFENSWRPRNMGRSKQDWTTGRGGNPRLMLNTDVSPPPGFDAHARRFAVGPLTPPRARAPPFPFFFDPPPHIQMCLVFDISEHVERRIPCCSRTAGGADRCVDREAARRQCPMYGRGDPRRQASDAVRNMLGGEFARRTRFRDPVVSIVFT